MKSCRTHQWIHFLHFPAGSFSYFQAVRQPDFAKSRYVSRREFEDISTRKSSPILYQEHSAKYMYTDVRVYQFCAEILHYLSSTKFWSKCKSIPCSCEKRFSPTCECLILVGMMMFPCSLVFPLKKLIIWEGEYMSSCTFNILQIQILSILTAFKSHKHQTFSLSRNFYQRNFFCHDPIHTLVFLNCVISSILNMFIP